MYKIGMTNLENSEMFQDYPDIISIDQLRSMLHIGRNMAYHLLKSGQISTIRIGKKYVIPKTSVIDFVLSAKTAS